MPSSASPAWPSSCTHRAAPDASASSLLSENRAPSTKPSFAEDSPRSLGRPSRRPGHAYISDALANELVALGYGGANLDIADLCNKDRRLSRAIALHAYAAQDGDGSFMYSGIRYCSRIQPGWECWAIFDGGDLFLADQRQIEEFDTDLKRVADMWDLRVH